MRGISKVSQRTHLHSKIREMVVLWGTASLKSKWHLGSVRSLTRLVGSAALVVASNFSSAVSADPVGPFPLGSGTIAPFPWDSIAGTWRVSWDQKRDKTSISISVQVSADGLRIVEVLTFDEQNMRVEQRGAGFEQQQGLRMSAVLIGPGPAVTLHMWVVEAAQPAALAASSPDRTARPQLQMKVALEGVDGLEAGQSTVILTGSAERISSESYEQMLRRKCATVPKQLENQRDSLESCR